jgi:nitroimidazol reductase NimA-like FMN-containing flavoprotein (pyridoxamine 5'-phosphate oxidase superfamily)
MENEMKGAIRSLLASQKLGVLATNQEGHPYTSLVGFAFSEDLRQLFFATKKASRKFANLQTDPRVSLLVDSRSENSENFGEIAAVSVFGTAREVTGLERQKLVAAYLDQHPELQEFAQSPNCVLVRIKVRRYALVRHLVDVGELSFES